ncbi:putative aminoacrylate peracid reductase RutC [mine drainage metagenome]|uniref:Putative aminoacrylate peracid reductase RutC n=1 Tax=mine drainage metagenome TaxID=410659 RepID=A0A1J5RWX4_9ZZZZ
MTAVTSTAAATVAVRSFTSRTGAAEHVLSVSVNGQGSFAAQCRAIREGYRNACRDLGLAEDSALFRRLFVSDAQNQAADLAGCGLLDEDPGNPVAVSLVEQAPLDGSKISLLACHVSGGAPRRKRRLAQGGMVMEANGLRHLWQTGLCSAASAPQGADEQTRQVFSQLTDALDAENGTLLDHCVRTWLYVRDVDCLYPAMVQARTDLFTRHGLTADSHYIASTGIEGAGVNRFDGVLMDAYSIVGLRPEQMSFLNDNDAMCPTWAYRVTFERGTGIAYDDRTHCFISGTASIDHKGDVLYPGDVEAQLERALDNVAAILRPAGGELSHMMYVIVYLRDASDAPAIRGALAKRCPGIPAVVVKGSVCRPEWLVEVEGVATVPHGQAGLPGY